MGPQRGEGVQISTMEYIERIFFKNHLLKNQLAIKAVTCVKGPSHRSADLTLFKS